MSTRIINPFPLYLNTRGDLLEAGSIYIGTVGSDPEASPVACYWDEALTIPAEQPLETRGGHIVNGASPANVFIAADDWSMRVRDSDGSQVWYVSSVSTTGTAYQPLSDALTALAALASTSFGRNLLTLANAEALRTAAEITPSLPSAGGTVTGAITRSGAGAHLFHADPAHVSGKFYVTNNGATDPTTQVGEIWAEKAP